MSKLEEVIADDSAELTPTARLVAVPKVTTAKAAKTVAHGLKATSKGTVFVAAKTIRSGRGLSRAFASFYKQVQAEMDRQDGN